MTLAHTGATSREFGSFAEDLQVGDKIRLWDNCDRNVGQRWVLAIRKIQTLPGKASDVGPYPVFMILLLLDGEREYVVQPRFEVKVII